MKYIIVLCMLCVMLAVAVCGPVAGYTVDGTPHGGDFGAEESFEFIWNLSSFQIDGLYPAVALFWDVIILAMIIMIIASWVRGIN